VTCNCLFAWLAFDLLRVNYSIAMPNTETESELTPPAKLAILRYLILLLAPPAIVLSVLTFLLGFFIREGAMDKALGDAKQKMLDALKETNQKIVGPIVAANLDAQKAKESAEKAEEISKKAEDTSRRVTAANDELAKTLNQLENLKDTLNVKGEAASQIAKIIISDKDFNSQPNPDRGRSE
jgi:hypothetical protein